MNNFNKSFFRHFLVKLFFLFLWYLHCIRVTQCSGLRKYQKLKYFWKCNFWGGLFWTKRCFFFMESLRNLQILIFRQVHNIFPLTYWFDICCVKKLPSWWKLFFKFFFKFCFSRFTKKNPWFIYEIM
jgi:hypothetical protein